MDDSTVTVAKLINQNLSGIIQALKTAFPLSGSTGVFTMTAGTPSTSVKVPTATASTFVALMPLTGSASTAAIYVSARTAGTGFTVTTGAGGNAAGTEQFQYITIG